MPSLTVLTVIGVIVLAALMFVFLKVRQGDLLGAMMEKRRPGARIVSRAEYVEGNEAIPVALSLTNETIVYENPDLEASFELSRIDEIEYAEDLATGKNHSADSRVLRLRSHGATFEFLLPKADSARWEAAMPPKTYAGAERAM